MARVERFSGLLSPVLTPFGEDLSPDVDRLIGHCKWLLERDCNLAPFGTTSEGNSLSAAEKADILAYMLEMSGFPAGDTELPTRVRELNRVTFHALQP